MIFFRRRKRDARTNPQPEPARVAVDVTARERQRGVIDHGGYTYDRPLDPDLSGCDVANVRRHLAAAVASENLKAARYAAVLDRHADFLTGTTAPPEREEVIAAERFAAEFIRDRIVIGSRA